MFSSVIHMWIKFQSKCRFNSLWSSEPTWMSDILVNNGLGRCLSLVKRQAFTWPNPDLLLIELSWTNFSEIWTKLPFPLSYYISRDANIQFSKCLMILRLSQKNAWYMMKWWTWWRIFHFFCLISLIFFVYIKQKWIFQGLKWKMIK